MIDAHGESWHLSKSINISHLITTGAIVVSAFMFVNSFDNRLTSAEIEIHHLKEVREADIKRENRRFDDIKSDLRIINRKLDRLISSGAQTSSGLYSQGLADGDLP